MRLELILEAIEQWQTVYDYGQPPTAARVEAALAGEAVTLRKGDGLTVSTRAVNLHVDRLNDDRLTVVVYYDATRNGVSSTAALELTFSNGSWGHTYGRRGNLPNVYASGKFITYPQGAIDLIHEHYAVKFAGFVEAGLIDGATALVEALDQYRRARISRALHVARMALDDVAQGVTR
jgi:hypothetical protein